MKANIIFQTFNSFDSNCKEIKNTSIYQINTIVTELIS